MARPSKYRKSFCDLLIKIFSDGGDVGYFMAQCKISKKTFYNWLESHPEFRDAYEEAKPHSYVYDSEILKLGATGAIKGFNATAWAMRMNARHEDFGFSRNVDKAGTVINVDKMLNYNSSTGLRELDQKISELLESQPDLMGVIEGEISDDSETE